MLHPLSFFMGNSAKIFVLLNVLLLLFAGLSGGISIPVQIGIAAIFIGLVGIPHGAIDHILFLQNAPTQTYFFYGFYFGLIAAIVAIWLFFPLIGLLFFLVLSAYHFGQSQFSKYKNLSKKVKSVIYFTWGSSILSALTVYNYDEILQICSSSADLSSLLVIFQYPAQLVVLLISTLGFLSLFFYHYKAFTLQKFAIELVILLLIHFSFYAHSILIGFSIYFATLHSLEVLSEEYGFLKSNRQNFNLKSFIALLTPYTLISLIGLAMLLALSHFEVFTMSKTLIVFIAISALTLPHSVVMEKFYRTSQGRIA